MKKTNFRRSLLSAILIFVPMLLLLEWVVMRYVSRQQAESVRAQLGLEAGILSAESVTNWQDWVTSAAQRANARVAVLGREGGVIADSEPYSHGQDRAAESVAVPMGSHTLRLSAPLGSANAMLVGLRWRMAGVSFLSAVLISLVSYLSMRSFSDRVDKLRVYVEGLPDSSREELSVFNDELGALSSSLRHTASHIRDLVGRLQLESARREAILGGMVEGVLAVDRELRVTFCNASFARAAGAPMPVREGVALVQLVRDPRLIQILAEVVEKGERVNRRLQLRSTRAHTFEVQAGPLDGPTGQGALAILHDVTELDRLERIRKDFVANVSHELRTPLASIRGYAETLLDGALEDPAHNRKFLEIILAQSIRLNNISSDLLTISELESAGASTAPTRISVRTCLEAAVRTVEAIARVDNVALVRGEIDDCYVLGHQIRLEQALINLLINAVKFNRPQGEVRFEAGELEEGHVLISIIDTGVGIPASDLPRIFERFYRVDRARSRAVGGTGLGLSIVKHVAEQMGGSVQVESQLGKGSRFMLRIPSMSPSSKPVHV